MEGCLCHCCEGAASNNLVQEKVLHEFVSFGACWDVVIATDKAHKPIVASLKKTFWVNDLFSVKIVFQFVLTSRSSLVSEFMMRFSHKMSISCVDSITPPRDPTIKYLKKSSRA